MTRAGALCAEQNRRFSADQPLFDPPQFPECLMIAFVVSNKFPWRVFHSHVEALRRSIDAFLRRHIR